MSNRASSGKRIRFEKLIDEKTGHNLLSAARIFSNGEKYVRLILDIDAMEYYIKDHITGHTYESGGNVTNQEVLQRKAKKALKKFLDIHFEKEERNAGRFKK